MDTETEQQVYAVELVRKMGELPAVILLEEERKEWHDSISQIHRIYNVQASVWLLWKLYSFERDKLPAIITYEKARECYCFSEADDYIDYLLQHANNEPEILRWLETERIVRELQKKSVLCVRLRTDCEEPLLAPRLWCRRLRNFIAAFRKNWNQAILLVYTGRIAIMVSDILKKFIRCKLETLITCFSVDKRNEEFVVNFTSKEALTSAWRGLTED